MRITGDGLRHLAGMTGLWGLHLFSCTLNDEALTHIPRLPSVTSFSLNSSSGCTTACLECLHRLESVTSFSLNGAPAAGPGLRHLAALTRLTDLGLDSGTTRIVTDDDLTHLPHLPTVTRLSLHRTFVTDAGLPHLYRLPALESLDLAGTSVSDAGIPHLAAMPALRSANLNHTKVTLSGVRELQAARPGLDISARDCTGEPPREPDPAALIRRPERREAAPVARSWARIEAWFAANLPEALATLRPPASVIDPDVRMVAEGHAIVTHGEPRPEGTCGGTGRVRWHLRLHKGKWRIERHEGVDDPTKPWRLDLS